MNLLSIPGESNRGTPPFDGVTVPLVRNVLTDFKAGYSYALFPPTAAGAVRVNSMHKDALVPHAPGPAENGASYIQHHFFAAIRPYVFRDIAARQVSASRHGFNVESIQSDSSDNLFRPPSSFTMYRPGAIDTSNIVVRRLLASQEKGGDFYRLVDKLPVTLLFSDEGMMSENRFPISLAREVKLGNDIGRIVGLSVSLDENRPEPLLSNPQEPSDDEIAVGRVAIDQLVIVDGKTNYTSMGYSFAPPLPEAYNPLLAGVMVTTSGELEYRADDSDLR